MKKIFPEEDKTEVPALKAERTTEDKPIVFEERKENSVEQSSKKKRGRKRKLLVSHQVAPEKHIEKSLEKEKIVLPLPMPTEKE